MSNPCQLSKSFHGIRPARREIALEQHSVKTGDDSRDAIARLFGNRIHSGVLQHVVS